VLEAIAKKLKIPLRKFWDLCKLMPNWEHRTCYNSLFDPIPKDVVLFVNPPFSKSAAFIRLVIALFAKGYNIVLLIPACSAYGSEFATIAMQKFGEIVSTPLPIFTLVEGDVETEHRQTSLKTITIIYLLHPNLTDS